MAQAKNKFIIVTIIIAIVSGAVIAFVASSIARGKLAEIRKQQDMENLEQCRTVVQAIDKQLYIIERIVVQNANVIERLPNLTDAEIHKLMTYAVESSNEKNPILYGGCIAFEPNMLRPDEPYAMFYAYYNSQTGLLTNVDIDKEYDYFGFPWYCVPQHLLRPVWSEPYYDKGAGNALMTTCSVPFFRMINGRKTFAGIATADLTLDRLQEILDSYKNHDFDHLFMVSRFGLILSSPDYSQVMAESIYSIGYEHGRLESILKMRNDVRAGKIGKIESQVTLLGEKNPWIYYVPLKSNEWTMMMVYNPANHADRSTSIIVTASIIGVIIYLVVMIIVIVGSYLIYQATQPPPDYRNYF